jgi:DNA invertase Pin-like site-specific DNA recombinase
VIYARFSTDRQNEASTTLQLEECRKRAARLGLTLAAEYVDEDVSSGVPMNLRAAGGAALRALNRGDTLLVPHTDRFLVATRCL